MSDSHPKPRPRTPPRAQSWSVAQILARLGALADPETREGLRRYGIPNRTALGVPMRAIKALAKELGRHHPRAQELWETGGYEARTLAAFIDEPEQVTIAQMDAWAADFDNWAICDSVCFSLFDRAPDAWSRVSVWAADEREYVRRAAFALVWSLSVHDKHAADDAFVATFPCFRRAALDGRPHVKKGVDMALRAVGKRNRALHEAASALAGELADSADAHAAWIGRHALRELSSAKVLARFN